LYSSGLITIEEALRGASNPDEFRLRLAGIRSSADQAREEMENRSSLISSDHEPSEAAFARH